jgi:bla regulator protein BlaR1
MSTHLIASLGWALLDFIWQGALIGCATAALLAVLRNARPEWRYGVAGAGLLLCLAWPMVEFVQLASAGGDHVGALPRTLPSAQGILLIDRVGLLAWFAHRLGWLVAAWAVCAGLLGLRMAFGLAWIGHLMRAPSTDAVWQARLSHLAERFGIRRDVRLRVVRDLASPVTAGWWRPVVLVPASLLSGMPPELLEALLAHELAHVARHDYLVNLLQNVIEALLFYHPAVWWLSRRIRVERELVADAVAAERLGAPRRLAQALAELERLQPGPSGLALAASGGDLAARVRRLVRPERQALQWKAALPVLGLALACLANAHVPASALPGDGMLNRHPVLDFDHCAIPQYPQADIAALHEGKVDIMFEVRTDGTIGSSRVDRSSGYRGLDEAALTALSKCRFHPALQDGRPVAGWQPVQYVWVLK